MHYSKPSTTTTTTLLRGKKARHHRVHFVVARVVSPALAFAGRRSRSCSKCPPRRLSLIFFFFFFFFTFVTMIISSEDASFFFTLFLSSYRKKIRKRTQLKKRSRNKKLQGQIMTQTTQDSDGKQGKGKSGYDATNDGENTRLSKTRREEKARGTAKEYEEMT